MFGRGSARITKLFLSSNKLEAQRRYSECATKKGLVLGAYEGCQPGEFKLTPMATQFDEEVCGRITELLKGAGLKRGKALVFGNMGQEFHEVAVAGLGDDGLGYTEAESMDMCKENVRLAAGMGARALQDRGATTIMVEGFTSPEAAAEGAYLGVWKYQELKEKEHQTLIPALELYCHPDTQAWKRGKIKAQAQNLARRLEETPANLMTPSIFAQSAIEILCPCGVHVDVRGRDWLETQKMMAFLTVARSSCEPPIFLQMSYCGAELDAKPVVMTGKGITYDTGGLNLKDCSREKMVEYKADMAGGAVLMGVMKAVSQMNLPINIHAIVPLCENMFGGLSMKPGDVVLGLNGKTIRIENTDNEGRVILADALAYSVKHKPCLVMNVADFTRSMSASVGEGATGVFSSSDDVWEEMRRAGGETGDRVWRFPFWKHYHAKVTEYMGVDVGNVGTGRGGEPCLGAAFLLEFVPNCDFMHMDISGTGMTSTGRMFPYLRKGMMTGRPTRTLVQFLYQVACPHHACLECPCEPGPYAA